MTGKTPGETADEPATAGRSTTLRVASTDLFHGQREIVILHHGTEYRLHITRADKLILTK